jgi:3-methyladenine DNA glycosylase Tag
MVEKLKVISKMSDRFVEDALSDMGKLLNDANKKAAMNAAKMYERVMDACSDLRIIASAVDPKVNGLLYLSLRKVIKDLQEAQDIFNS